MRTRGCRRGTSRCCANGPPGRVGAERQTADVASENYAGRFNGSASLARRLLAPAGLLRAAALPAARLLRRTALPRALLGGAALTGALLCRTALAAAGLLRSAALPRALLRGAPLLAAR